MAKTDFVQTKPSEQIKPMQVRFRTIGDATCTGATISDADSLEKIIEEVAASRLQKEVGELMIKDLKQLWRIEKRRILLKK